MGRRSLRMICVRNEASIGDNVRKRVLRRGSLPRRTRRGYFVRIDTSENPEFDANSSRRSSTWDIDKGLADSLFWTCYVSVAFRLD
jgi:hypothetical protein